MRWLLHSRWARSLAIVGVYLLSFQALGLTRIAFAEAVDECCCHHRGANCSCPVCSHERAVKSGKPFMQGCGVHAEQVEIIALEPTLPAPPPQGPAPRVAFAPPREQPRSLVEAPPREVPTPPPLRSAV
jgi:hypothetical protein